jgi:hypothetical protein
VADPTLEKKFAELNSSLDILVQQIEQFKALTEDAIRPFFHCWFLSVPQLMILLDTVTSPESFRDALWMTRHIDTGTSDFYATYAYMRRLRDGAGS